MGEQALVTVIRCLEQAASLYENLLEMSQKQTEAIVQRQLDVIKALTQQQQTLVSELGRLEKTRMGAMDVLASHFSVTVKDLTISRLKELLAPKVFQLLEAPTKRLEKTVSELSHISQQNAKLLDSSIEFIDFSIHLITSPAAAEAGYNQQGEESAERPEMVRRLFDVKS